MSVQEAVRVLWDIKIPLRDGTHLSATLYRPGTLSAPTAAVVTMTPYVADIEHDRGMSFALHGFVFVAVDVRGRGNSEGRFDAFIQEADDGYDVIEWLAKQPYCNGNVGMSGGSYSGYCQWATAKQLPPHLKTIMPTASPFLGIDFPMRSNIFFPYAVQWIAFTAGRALQPKLFADQALWSRLYREWYESGLPFSALDTLCHRRSSTFQDWLRHPEPDDYWARYNPTTEQYAGIDLPVLTITGCYDDDQRGALEHYFRHLRAAPPGAQLSHYLIIGPWDHLGTGKPVEQFGGIHFGIESVIDLAEIRAQWCAWIMDGGTKPTFLKDRVAYYMAVANEWRYADALERVTVRDDLYFLDSDGSASSPWASGNLRGDPRDGAYDTYTYDPRDVSGPEICLEEQVPAGSLTDQSLSSALGGRRLVYQSLPLLADLEVCGFFRLSLWVALDAPDTDLYASVYEVELGGQVVRLSCDAIRARYREGLTSPRLIDSDGPLQYNFGHFNFVSRRLLKGHRLRLVIAPVGRLIDAPFAQRNYNGGGIVAGETVEQGRKVTVRVFHDKAHQSVLHLPIGRPSVEGLQ